MWLLSTRSRDRKKKKRKKKKRVKYSILAGKPANITKETTSVCYSLYLMNHHTSDSHGVKTFWSVFGLAMEIADLSPKCIPNGGKTKWWLLQDYFRTLIFHINVLPPITTIPHTHK